APHIVLLDFGSPTGRLEAEAAKRLHDKIGSLPAHTLVLGCGSNDHHKSFPGWDELVLSTGPLFRPGPGTEALWDSELQKPDLFAPATLEGSELVGMV